MTAPVRETVAQALGLALKRLDVASVQAVAALLVELQAQQDWRVRYGERPPLAAPPPPPPAALLLA